MVAIKITSRGSAIARLQAEMDPAEEVRQWLKGLRERLTLVDVVAPRGPESADACSADDDHP